MTALMYAAGSGHTEIVELLLKQDYIDINEQDVLNQKYL